MQQINSAIAESESISPNDLMGQFNVIFEGLAKATFQDGELFITIGNRTMIIQLPMVSGAQSRDQSR